MANKGGPKKEKEADVGEVGETYEVSHEDPLTCHRASNFLRLGFEMDDSIRLAKVRDEKGVFLYHGDIQKLLDQGATHQQIVDIRT